MSQAHGQSNPILDTFKLVAETQKQLEHVTRQARAAVKAHYHTPEALAAFIEQHQTPVHHLKGGIFGALLVFLLGFEPGYIAPAANRRYRLLITFLNLTNPRPGTHAGNGVFLMTRKLFTVGFLTHQLHHWLSCRAGFGGYNERSQELYKKFWNEQHGIIGAEVDDMSVDDIICLKDAIRRDLEALEFLRSIVEEVFQPGNQAGLFKTAGRASA